MLSAFDQFLRLSQAVGKVKEERRRLSFEGWEIRRRNFSVLHPLSPPPSLSHPAGASACTPCPAGTFFDSTGREGAWRGGRGKNLIQLAARGTQERARLGWPLFWPGKFYFCEVMTV